MGREGRHAINEAFHNGFGLSVRVFEHDRKPADPFHQRCHVGLAKFLSEHDQIALPVTELNTFSNGFRTVPDSQFLKKLASMVLPHAARHAVASMARQMLVERNRPIGTACLNLAL